MQGVRVFCTECLPEFEREHRDAFVAAGPEAMQKLRKQGLDPSATPDVRRRIGEKIAERSEEAWTWDRHNARPDRETFEREILPDLQVVSVRRMQEATGLSKMYCSRVKRGLQVPHPRHWEL